MITVSVEDMYKFRLIAFTIIFIAKSGFAASLDNKVTGVEKSVAKNVTARLAAQQHGITLTASSIKQLYQEAPAQIKQALKPYGYFKPEITAQLKEVKAGQWQASYRISPGPQLLISKVDIHLTGPGAAQPQFQQFLATQPIHTGQPLLTENYNNTKKALFTLAEQLGYLDAQLTKHMIRVNLERYTAEVILKFDTGHRYYFGKVNFQKNPLSSEFLQRYVRFKQGQPYSADDVVILQKDLNNSNFFQQALVKPNKQQAHHYEIPLEVTLIPRKSQQYSFGAGYGTDTGPRASIGWDWRYLTQTGHHLSSLLRLSPVQNTVQAVYVIPGENPLTDQYNINASVLKNQLPRGDNIVSKIGVASITNTNGWTQTLALNKQYERYRFSDQADYKSSKLLLPGITWQRTVSDNALYPLNGYRVSLNLQGTNKALLSDTNLAQITFNGKYIHRLGEKGRALLRADLGYTTVKNLSTELPLSLSYFAGGSRSVRGYSYQALGPGRYQMVGSVEYQHQVIKNWNAAIFFDAGNAFMNLPQNVFSSLQQGAGLGVVWISPIGPINLSVAKALNWPGQPTQIQFSMGPDL